MYMQLVFPKEVGVNILLSDLLFQQCRLFNINEKVGFYLYHNAPIPPNAPSKLEPRQMFEVVMV